MRYFTISSLHTLKMENFSGTCFFILCCDLTYKWWQFATCPLPHLILKQYISQLIGLSVPCLFANVQGEVALDGILKHRCPENYCQELTFENELEHAKRIEKNCRAFLSSERREYQGCLFLNRCKINRTWRPDRYETFRNFLVGVWSLSWTLFRKDRKIPVFRQCHS